MLEDFPEAQPEHVENLNYLQCSWAHAALRDRKVPVPSITAPRRDTQVRSVGVDHPATDAQRKVTGFIGDAKQLFGALRQAARSSAWYAYRAIHS
jgi:hypothetical protein